MNTFAQTLIFAAFAYCASADEEATKQRLAELGGKTFVRKGQVVEVVLNKTQVEDKDLAALLAFPELTDLSLENT
ncbi:MAG: hypothetical protein VCA36_01715, partial [Opitutales bacterium]